MEQTVSQAERHLGQLCSLMGAYTRKTARLRDKADLLVAQLYDFSGTEDPELQLGLKNLAEDLAMVQDYRQAQVERLESRVVAPLKTYGDIVRTKRADLKKLSADGNREMKEIQKLEKIRLKNPADRQSISQAEVSAQKASNNAQRSNRQLEDAIMEFQRLKLEDVKRIFMDFVTVEMLFHAKALEVYTHTFHNLDAMELHKDLELFCGRIKMSDFVSGRVDSPVSAHSGPLTGLYRSPLLASTAQQSHRDPPSPDPHPIPRPRSTLQWQRRMEKEEAQREEEEEEEEEEEMYESEEGEGQPTSRLSYAAQYPQVRRWQKVAGAAETPRLLPPQTLPPAPQANRRSHTSTNPWPGSRVGPRLHHTGRRHGP